MQRVTGGCYCGNITFDMGLPNAPGTYNPRACDCRYCLKHGAAYVSDPNGHLAFYVRQMEWFRRYKQDGTSGLAEFLQCINCGVLVGVVLREKDQTWGAVNSLAAETGAFGEKVSVSPKQLSDDEKIKRWKQAWFNGVRVIANIFVHPPL